jgi:hypothetical protein
MESEFYEPAAASTSVCGYAAMRGKAGQALRTEGVEGAFLPAISMQ